MTTKTFAMSLTEVFSRIKEAATEGCRYTSFTLLELQEEHANYLLETGNYIVEKRLDYYKVTW